MAVKKKLFAVYLGGKCKGARIEVHDIAFVVAPTVKAAFPRLKQLWFGEKGSAHVDSWCELAHVDGFDVSIQKKTSSKTQKEKLYFINIGSYQNYNFGEKHDFYFLAGADKAEIRKRAKGLVAENQLVHVDDFVEVDDLIEITEVDGETICLTPSSNGAPLVINNVYWPIKDTK